MLGSIAGDICGSPYEGGQCPRDRMTFFGDGCCFTDDTVCSVAVAQALLAGLEAGRPSQAGYAESLRKWVAEYPGRGYGGLFIKWAHGTGGPYDSFGNGGAMRVAAVGWLAQSEQDALDWAKQSSAVTHNHPEGVRGAQAIALSIWLTRQGLDPVRTLARVLQRTGYGQPRSVEEYAEVYGFSTLAIDTVPRALACAFEARSWADAVRNACHMGGDSDTIACMAGAIAEARFGLPREHAQNAWMHLTPEIRVVVEQVYARAGAMLPTDKENLTVEPAPGVSEAPPARLNWLRAAVNWLRGY